MSDLLNRRIDLMQTKLSYFTVGYAANLMLVSITSSIQGSPANFSGTNSYAHESKLQLTPGTSTAAYA